MKLSFVLAASFFVTVTGKASSPFDLESSSELMGCRDTNCYTLCEAAALDALYDATGSHHDFNASKVRFTIHGNAPSCNCGLGKCCNTAGSLHEENEKCFGDDGKNKCVSGNRACCCYYDGLDLKMQDKLKTDSPFLRAPVPELN
eukprot:scaffold45117_cov32-Cyclotella_meneghiniana.AAC.4